jgi:hypothetical protein
VNDDELGRICWKWSWPNFMVLFRLSLGGTEESHESLNQDGRSPRPRIEPETSLIRNWIVNHSTTTFGIIHCEIGTFYTFVTMISYAFVTL